MKKALCIFLTLILVFSMTACQKDDTTLTTASLLEGYDPAAETNLEIGNPSGNALTADEIYDGFKAAFPNIKVTVDTTPWGDYMTKLKTQLAANNPADCFITDSGYLQSLGGKDAVLDIKGVVDRDLDPEQYVSSALYSGLDAEGHLWGVPHAMNSIAILYNKDLFDEAGIDYPTADWTYEEMFDIAKKLTKDTDGDGEMDIYGYALSPFITEGWLPAVLAGGGRPLSDDRKTSEIASAASMEGWKRYVQPIKENFAPTSHWITINGSKELCFVNGKIAMILTSASNLKGIADMAGDSFNYDAQVMPVGWTGVRPCVYVPNQWSIYAGSPEQEQGAAWEWIKYYLSPESQMIVGQKRLAGFPINKVALKAIEDEDTKPVNMKAYFEKIETDGVTLFENPVFSEWTAEVQQISGELYNTGGENLEEQVKLMDQKVQEALDYYYAG